jgi:hypothetical protein
MNGARIGERLREVDRKDIRLVVRIVNDLCRDQAGKRALAPGAEFSKSNFPTIPAPQEMQHMLHHTWRFAM